MPKFQPNRAAPGAFTVVGLRCPACRRLGSFGGLGTINDLVMMVPHQVQGGDQGFLQTTLGIRICPNPKCQEIVFVNMEGEHVIAYPAKRLDFEPTDIPQNIVASFEEAITGHANQCFRSAAIIVRRTLEEICDYRGATGKDLKVRLKSLGTKIVIPEDRGQEVGGAHPGRAARRASPQRQYLMSRIPEHYRTIAAGIAVCLTLIIGPDLGERG
jgi:hypothetical protein